MRKDSMTNCPNCGATLHGDKCEYCGTEFLNLINLRDMREPILVNVNGIKMKMYVSKCEMTVMPFCGADAGRDIDGRLHISKITPKSSVQVTLMEF